MTRRAARDIKNPTGRIVVRKGETVDARQARPAHRVWDAPE